MNDQYFEDIKVLIQQNGAMGVNAISKAIDKPLSTVQKYMHRQSYFKMNDQRKWDLPESVATKEIQSTISNFDQVIESQLSGITSLSDMLITQIKSTITILSAQKPIIATVADKSPNIDKRLIEFQNNANKLKEITKKQKANIPDEYYDLIFNYDHIGLVMKEGSKYALEFLEGDIYSMLAGNARELSEETVEILRENQIEA
jgi:hypothetical protein